MMPFSEIPVVLLVYNRPWTTHRVFEAVRAARPCQLLVVGDGPHPERFNDVQRCAEVRSVINGVDWHCDVRTNFSHINLGTAARVASGFDWVFEQVEEAIVLEDDCLPHPDFFNYCAVLLNRYRENPKVMWIGGTNPFHERRGDGSYFFSRINWMWGWATWKRAWQHFDRDLAGFPAFLKDRRITAITPYRRLQDGFLAMFEKAYQGQWSNWDIRATFMIWANEGIVIHPNGNLISNIGFGEGAMNTKSTSDPLASLPMRPPGPIMHPSSMRIDTEYDVRVFDRYMMFAADMGRARRYRKTPFYRLARSCYSALKARA